MMRYINNPANIRYSASNLWVGQQSAKTGFCQFDELEHGVRALMIIIKNYYYKHDAITVTKLIARFAPPSENNTVKYIMYVSKRLSVQPNDIIAWNINNVVLLVKAICMYETHTILTTNFCRNVYRTYNI